MDFERFKVGDLLSRNGIDRYRVLEVAEDYSKIFVECLKGPFTSASTGSRAWCEVGEREWNSPKLYDYLEEFDDADRF